MSRIRHVHGFGIHSPSAYRFAREVINSRRRTKECKELGRSLKGVPHMVRRLGELYFRISLHVKCDIWLDWRWSGDVYKLYVELTGRQIRFIRSDECFEWSQFGKNEHLVVRATVDDHMETFYEEVINHANEHSILILEPSSNRKAFCDLWKKILDDDRTGVTFDLYYCGIVFFDKYRPKQNHIVNF